MSQPERLLLRSAASGQLVDLRTGIQSQDDATHGSEWPSKRCIRAEILASCLLDSSQAPKSGIPILRLAGARITGRLDLGGADLVKAIWFEQCYFDEPPNLADARTRTVRIVQSYLPGLNALSTKIDGQLDLTKTMVKGRLRLVMTHVTGELSLNGSTLVNSDDWTLFAGGLTVDGGVFCRRGFESQGPIRLVGAHLNGGIFLDGARLNGVRGDALIADNLRVEGRMVCDDLVADGALRLPGARINGQLSWDGATIQATEEMGLDLRRLIAEELILTTAKPVLGIIDLGGARVSVLRDDPMTWPTDIRLDGFCYDSLAAPSKRDKRDGRRQRYPSDSASTSADTLPARSRLAWLSLNRVGYRPQPFEQLAAFYRRIGHDDQARKVLLVKQRRRRSTQNVGGKLWGYLLDWSVGYGYRPWLAAIWLISLIAIGSITFAWRPPPPVDQATSPPFNSLVYTINLLLPAGQFVQPDQWNLNGPERWFAYSLVGTGWLLASTVIAGVTRVLNRSLFLPSSPAPYGHDRPFAVGHGHARIVEICADTRRFGYAQTATQAATCAPPSGTAVTPCNRAGRHRASQFDLLLSAAFRAGQGQPGERLGGHDHRHLVPGGLKRGDDGGCQLRELPATLPASEQIDIAAGPVPHAVGCDRVPAGQREPVPCTCREGDPRYPLVPGFHRPAARLRCRRDAADLCQNREPLLPRPSELCREPQHRPQPPPQDLLIQIRVQILRAGRLDQDGTVEINNPARRIKVVDRVPRPIQMRRQVNSAHEGPCSRSNLSGTAYGRRYREPEAPCLSAVSMQ
jgi:hypothetical protein